MATESIWITIVSILALFDITKEIGEDGQVVEPSYEYGSDLIWYEVHFCGTRKSIDIHHI
jgi:hypothetical protein